MVSGEWRHEDMRPRLGLVALRASKSHFLFCDVVVAVKAIGSWFKGTG